MRLRDCSRDNLYHTQLLDEGLGIVNNVLVDILVNDILEHANSALC